MTADRRRSPLGHLAGALAAGGREGVVTLREEPFLAQVDVRVDPARAAAMEAALGVPLPLVPNTTASADGRTALWLGPDEWLMVGADGTQGAIEAAVREALGDAFGSVVDVSANRTALRLAGPCARAVLEKGCSVDLHPRAFSPGACAQTLVARAQVILEQLGPEPAYRLFVRPSFAEYLATWLVDAMTEFAAAEAQPPSRSSVRRRQRSVRSTSLNV